MILQLWPQYPLWVTLLLAGIALACIRFTCLVVYRIWLHPLAAIPGPKLAAATQLYEIYYDVVKGGQYIWEIERLHRVYGPVVRVTPDEVHVLDPDFLNEIYAGPGRTRHKHHFHVSNIPNTLLGAELHGDHRRRRAVFSSFFTKDSIRKLEPLISHKTSRLLARIEDHLNTRQVLHFNYAAFGWACDTISNICFGQDWRHLEHPTFDKEHADSAFSLLKSLKILTHVKWITPVVLAIPPKLIASVAPALSHALCYKPLIRQAVQTMIAAESTTKEKWSRQSAPINVFSYVYQDPTVPAHLKTVDQLARDGELFVGAGEGTVASVLSLTFTYLHLFPRTLRRLRRELSAATAASPSLSPSGNKQQHLPLAELSNLPYLTAVLKEGLRLQHGLTKRMPRIAPDEDLVCGTHIIPRGTPMSTMAPLIHLNPDVFPLPQDFIPERWMEDAELARLDLVQTSTDGSLGTDGTTRDPDACIPPRTHSIAYMSSKIITFSRGARVCLGADLAWAELYICLAALLTTFDFELFETDMRDVTLHADKVVPEYHPQSKGFRFSVVAKRSTASSSLDGLGGDPAPDEVVPVGSS